MKTENQQVKRKKITRKVAKLVSSYAFLIPAFFILALTLIYPIVSGFELSLSSWRLGQEWNQKTFVGFSNYLELFKSEAFYEVLKVTAIFVFGAVSIELILGLILALILEKQIKGLTIFRTIFILPFMIAPVVVGLIWRLLYQPDGLINYYLGFLGFSPQLWLADPSLALISIILTDIWQWTPFIFVLILAGLQNLPSDPLEAAAIDGASYIQTLFLIKLPLLKPVLGVTVMLRTIDALKALEVMFNMTFGGPGRSTTVWALQVYKVAFMSQRLDLASAYATLLLVIQLSLAIGLIKFMKLEV